MISAHLWIIDLLGWYVGKKFSVHPVHRSAAHNMEGSVFVNCVCVLKISFYFCLKDRITAKRWGGELEDREREREREKFRENERDLPFAGLLSK